MENIRLRKIISGGRNGAERVALEIGRLLGLEIGGVCTQGQLSAWAWNPVEYPLTEITGLSDADCLRSNMEAADAVLILDYCAESEEAKLAMTLAEQFGKPYLRLVMYDGIPYRNLHSLLWETSEPVLLITGPRDDAEESSQRAIAAYLARLLSETHGRKLPVLPEHLRPAPVIYTIMPDFGMGPWAWCKPVDDMSSVVGGNISDAVSGWGGDHPISAGLVGQFGVWVRWFESFCNMPEFDWEAFHKIGRALTAQLKREVGAQARVVYRKAFEDPNHAQEENIETHTDGTYTVLVASVRGR